MIRKKEPAVSDVIGVILLISIATLALGIVGVQLISQVNIQQVPNADIYILKSSENPHLYLFYHERGDPLAYNRTNITFRNDAGVIVSNDSPFIQYYNESTPHKWSEKLCGEELKFVCPCIAGSVIMATYSGSGNITAMVQYNPYTGSKSPGNPMTVLQSATFPWWV